MLLSKKGIQGCGRGHLGYTQAPRPRAWPWEGWGQSQGMAGLCLGRVLVRLGTLVKRESKPNPYGCLCVMKMGKDGRIWPKDCPVQSSNIQVETG